MPIHSKHSREGKSRRFVANSTLFINSVNGGSTSKSLPVHCKMRNQDEAICKLRSNVLIHVDDVVEIAMDQRHFVGKVQEISRARPNHHVVARCHTSGTGDGKTSPRPPRPFMRIVEMTLMDETEQKRSE